MQLKEFTIDTNYLIGGTVPNEVCALRTLALTSLIVESCQSNVNSSTTTSQAVQCPVASGSGNSNSSVPSTSSSPLPCCTSCRS